MATALQNGAPVRPLVSLTDENILNAIRNEASPEYQRRIPAATKANISESLQNIKNLPNLRNEFYGALINQFCGMYVNSLRWKNPLAEFKRPAQSRGKIQAEFAVGLTKGRDFDVNQEYLGDDIWGTHNVQIKSVFHDVNREEYYPITINESQLNYAEPQGDTGFIASLMTEIMESPTTSDNYDEFLAMCNLFPEYAKMGGYWKIHTDDVSADTSTQGQAQSLLRKIRTMVNTLPLKPYTRYNAAHMPTVVKREDIVIFMSPAVHAAIDVNALAMLFNESYAQANARIFDIPPEQFGMDGVQAILTTKNFFYVWDYMYTTSASPQNMITLGTNYALHHKESISLSPFASAILFWTGDGSQEIINALGDITIDNPTIQIQLLPYGGGTITPTGATRGARVQVVANATSANYPELDNLGVKYEIVSNSDGVAGAKLPTSQFTRLSNTGVLLTGLDETASTITVQATVTYVNPATPEAPDTRSATLAIPVGGEGLLGLQSGFVTDVTVTAMDESIKVGDSTLLQAVATLTDGRTADVSNLATWTVSDTSVATVDVDGTLTGVKAGTASVTAKMFGATSTAVNVTVTAA